MNYVAPFHYDEYFAVAPGIVLIKAPGHTPGSQMVYVISAAGNEYLFMGDVASLLDNVRLVRIRSHYVTDFLSRDDRAAVFAETQALHRLAAGNPSITLVPGHDGVAIEDLIRKELLKAQFQVEPLRLPSPPATYR